MVREERQQKYFPCSMTHDTVDAVLCIVDMLSRGEGCVRLQWLCACPEADPLPLQSRMHAGAWWLVTVTTRTTDRLDKCYKQTPTTADYFNSQPAMSSAPLPPPPPHTTHDWTNRKSTLNWHREQHKLNPTRSHWCNDCDCRIVYLRWSSSSSASPLAFTCGKLRISR